MTKGIIFDIKRYAIHDGPGIRVTVFLKGCPLDCWWCHNPEGKSPLLEKMVRVNRSEGGEPFETEELVGREVAPAEVLAEIEKERLFFDESGGGVTFSGGEPLMQPEFLAELLRACKDRDINTALDTSGFAASDVFDSVVDLVDLFLFDLKLLGDDEHRKYTGVSNQPILANLRTLEEREKPTIIRFAIIPGITDTEANVNDISNLVASLKGIKKINLLPFHAIAGDKYKRLRINNRMEGAKTPSSDTIETIRAKFESKGLEVEIGG